VRGGATLVLLLLLAVPASADKLAELEAKRSAVKPSPAERARLAKRLRTLVGKPADPVVNLTAFWTRETLAFDPRRPEVDAETFARFLRCHFTGQATDMDTRLLHVLAGAARHFNAARIHIVSGFRAPKYNLILRKKGREVARDSQHTVGHAVDFRIPGVPTARLLAYVRSLRLGGTGFYPASAFVHADTGPIRSWAGK
jgi:uncharacterized protein YcbK (DUF882 family)